MSNPKFSESEEGKKLIKKSGFPFWIELETLINNVHSLDMKADSKFYCHIKEHLPVGQKVICKICNKTYEEIVKEPVKCTCIRTNPNSCDCHRIGEEKGRAEVHAEVEKIINSFDDYPSRLDLLGKLAKPKERGLNE